MASYPRDQGIRSKARDDRPGGIGQTDERRVEPVRADDSQPMVIVSRLASDLCPCYIIRHDQETQDDTPDPGQGG